MLDSAKENEELYRTLKEYLVRVTEDRNATAAETESITKVAEVMLSILRY